MTCYFDLRKLFLIGITVFWGCGLPPGIGPAPPFYSVAVSPIPISGLVASPVNPQVASDGTNVFVVWQDFTNGISYTYSASNGNGFHTPPIQIPGSTGGTYPRIATDGNGNVFVTWYDSSGTPSIKFSYVVAINTFPAPPLILSTAPASAPFGFQPSPPQEDINFTNGTLALAWSQCITTLCPSSDVYTSSATIILPLNLNPISSSSFSAPANISNSGFFAGYPRIKQTGNQPYIQYFQNSPTTGLVLYPGNTPTFQINTTVSYNSSMDIDSSGRAVSVWNPNPSFPNPRFDIFTSFLPPGVGKLFSSPQNISNNGVSYGPVLAVDSSGYFNLAFFSKSAGQTMNDVFLTRSTDGGVTFPSFFNLSMTPTGNSSSYAPGLTVVGKTAYLVWDEAVTVGVITTSKIYFEKLSLN